MLLLLNTITTVNNSLMDTTSISSSFPLFSFPLHSLKCVVLDKKQQNVVVGHATKLIAADLKYVTLIQCIIHFVIICVILLADWVVQ